MASINEVASLDISISTKGVDTAVDKLQELEEQSKQTETATSSLSTEFSELATGLAGAFLSIVSVSAIIDVSREFDILNTQLKTATGSAEGATVAFAALQEFAATTPYDLQQAVRAFVDLKNRGLEPSERALKSYGDTAAALGYSLEDMVQAVTNATSGEFETLKKFGIVARKTGDDINFTFKGVTTTVKNSAADIEQYLISIGENNFADAMIERSKTLDGAISNLQDSFDALLLTISNQGFSYAVKTFVVNATESIEYLNSVIAQSNISAYLEIWANRFVLLGTYVGDTVDTVVSAIDILSNRFDELFNNSVDSANEFKDEFDDVFHTIIADVKLATVSIAGLVDVLSIPFRTDSIKEWGQEFDKVIENVAASAEAIVNERNAAIRSEQEIIDKVKEEREEREKLLETLGKGGDRLIQFKDKPVATKSISTPASVENNKYNSVVRSLRNEEEALIESYARRKQIILQNTKENSDIRKELLLRNEKELQDRILSYSKVGNFDEQLKAIDDFVNIRKSKLLDGFKITNDELFKLQSELLDRLNADLKEQLSATDIIYKPSEKLAEIDKFYKKRKEIILKNIELTEQEKNKLLERYAEERKQIEASVYENSGVTAGIKKAMKDYGEEAKSTTELAESVWKKSMHNMEDALIKFTKTGKLEFKSLVDDIINELARNELRSAVNSIFSSGSGSGSSSGSGILGGVISYFSSSGGGGSGGGWLDGILSGIGSIFGGGAASGSDLQDDKVYMVGEQGPELLLVNKTNNNSEIVPLNKLNNNDSKNNSKVENTNKNTVINNYNINVTTPNAESFRRSAKQIKNDLLIGAS